MFSKKLKKAMNEAGLSQAELSRESGLSKSTISQYLSGKFEAKPNNLKILSKTLNKSMYWLCSEEDSEKGDLLIKDNKEFYNLKSENYSKLYDTLSILFSSEEFIKKSLKISKQFDLDNLQELLKLILYFEKTRNIK